MASVPAVTWNTEGALHRSDSAADSGPNRAADCSTDRAANTTAFAMALVGALLGASNEALCMADARRCREGEGDNRRRTEQPEG